MGWPQIVFGWLLVAGLLALSLFYARRQVRALRELRQRPELPAEEANYERRRARRRLVSCALTLLLGALLTGDLAFLEVPAQRLADQRDAQLRGEALAFDEGQLAFARLYGWYLIALLLVLLAVVFLAAFDLLATRRYGLRQHRKIQADRRAMIQRQVNRMREERNGHG